MRAWTAGAISILLVVPASANKGADKKGAQRRNAGGMADYKKGDYHTAGLEFQAAIDVDDDFVLAHYNLASVASIVGAFDVCAHELQWLEESPDKVAKQKLKKALTDPDFDRASTSDQIRDLLGLPAWSDLTVDQILTERDGYWTGIMEGCEDGRVDVRFKKGGRAIVDADGCSTDPSDKPTHEKATWKVDGDRVIVKSGILSATYVVGTCAFPQAGDRCLNDPDAASDDAAPQIVHMLSRGVIVDDGYMQSDDDPPWPAPPYD